MGEKVECPACGHQFYIHGYEEVEDCYQCNNQFNPQRHKV